MVDLIWRGAVSRPQHHLALLMCLALSTQMVCAARGEESGPETIARDASEPQLRQPRHFLPIPADSPSLPRSAWQRATATLGGADASEWPHSGQAVRFHAERGKEQNLTRQAIFQTSPRQPTTPANQLAAPAAPTAPADKKRDRCGSLVDRPFNDFGINIAMPSGDEPENYASQCWEPINAGAGPFVGARNWAATTFAWNATCFCHRPLYFEEINLERYGYGCSECMQPAASAAHFFATIPTLPYCMATDCPGDCIYTLGHYRPGSCPPWQCHWPRWSTRGALAEAGVWTGMVFLIP